MGFGGYFFTAYGYVPDYRFGLKTACKIDHQGWFLEEPYTGKPVDVTDGGFVVVEDPHEYFKNKGTIEDDLKTFPGGPKVIAAIHCPPSGLNLDVCLGYRRVGSDSVRKWIEREQPLLVLCGHIHESPWVSNTWKAKLGNTTIIQPGQDNPGTVFVDIKIGKRVEAKRLVV